MVTSKVLVVLFILGVSGLIAIGLSQLFRLLMEYGIKRKDYVLEINRNKLNLNEAIGKYFGKAK